MAQMVPWESVQDSKACEAVLWAPGLRSLLATEQSPAAGVAVAAGAAAATDHTAAERSCERHACPAVLLAGGGRASEGGGREVNGSAG
eukprot:scaffold54920_cov33-Tisochrysis_lutea.AAC.2